jgi:integrase
MATIRWRGKKEDHAHLCWCVNGVEQSTPLGRITPPEAERLRKAKEVELETGQKLFYAAAPFTEFRTRYLEWHAATYPDSHFRVANFLNGEGVKDFESKALSQITNEDIDTWTAKRLSRKIVNDNGKLVKVRRETARKEYSIVRAFFNKAAEWKKIAESPFEETTQPKKVKGAPPHWYKKPELEIIYQGTPAVATNYGDVWRFMAGTGVRRTEGLEVRVENADLERRVVHVLSREGEDEDEDDEDSGARTKSGKWREIPLNDNAYEAAVRLIAQYGETGYLLPRITGESLSRAFKRDIEWLNEHKGTNLKGTLHSLRHSYGTHMIKFVKLPELKELMGHANIHTTMIYLHIDDTDTKARARAANF